MKISFLIRSKSNPATIYLRARTDISDIKVKTNFSVNPANWENGQIKLNRVGRKVSKETHHKQEQNTYLKTLDHEMDNLKEKILGNWLKSRPVLSKEWLSEQINPSKPKAYSISSYVNLYFELSNLRPRTKSKVQSIVNRITAVQDFRLTEVNKLKRKYLIQELRNKGYAFNTIAKTIKVLQTLCRHAHENGYTVNPESLVIAKGLKYEKSPVVYLTEEEIDQISRADIDKKLHVTRDWLVISCLTGQRMGDLFTFTKKKIIIRENLKFLSIIQSKGVKPVLIPITPPVEAILKRYKDNFPPLLAHNPSSNEVIYNRLVKRVAKEAEIDSIIEANIRNPKTKRYEISQVPKWRAVSSHIGRRSFASNHYGKIATPLLMSITGHATERQFLEYIGKPQADHAIEAGRLLREYYLNKSNLEVISKTS